MFVYFLTESGCITGNRLLTFFCIYIQSTLIHTNSCFRGQDPTSERTSCVRAVMCNYQLYEWVDFQEGTDNELFFSTKHMKVHLQKHITFIFINHLVLVHSKGIPCCFLLKLSFMCLCVNIIHNHLFSCHCELNCKKILIVQP